MGKGDLVLITGGTGHIGFRTTILALEAGYRVRLSVRSQKRADAVLSAPTFKAIASKLAPNAITFTTVEDITTPGAFDNAVKGVDYVIHIASPITTGGQLSTDEYKEYFIKPAVQGTVGMLESAAKSPSVKRVAITTSVVAILPISEAFKPTLTLYNDDSRIPLDEGPYAVEFQAYSASKAAAYNATHDWIEKNKPSFDVVNLAPSFVMGKDDLDTSASGSIRGTNSQFINIALGKDLEGPMLGATVHLEDVARSHVQALDEHVPAGTYVLDWTPDEGEVKGTDWNDVRAAVKKLFPEAVEKGILPATGKANTVPLKVDGRKSERVFGFKYKTLEDQVESVIGHYLEFLEAGKE
ncbi:NAD(P)-binding protein [Rhizodiscina lignyota]|uniref:NAD(P)-binding protein n=1 Tax=Rhizodiscina lignyota TaxID=1504668 RepID=A0A9P4IKK3_9PEZI|nr:NAD(P)-binding protein [Rhizodiscina lignyota]